MVEAVLFFFAGVITLIITVALFIVTYEDLPIVKKYQKYTDKFIDIVSKVIDNIVPVFWLMAILISSASLFVMGFKSLLG